MAAPKTYFILRSTDYKPDGLIQLGQLIADARTPRRRMAPPFVPLPTGLLHQSHKRGWSFEKSNDLSHRITGIHKLVDSWGAATLETAFLELGEDSDAPYVKASVKEAAVQKWLKREKFLRKYVYMVTGVNIARQPGEAPYGISKGKCGAVKLGADPGTGGMVSVGVQGSLGCTEGIMESGTPWEDFVFANRLRKVHISLRNKVTLGGDLSGAELHSDGYVRDDTDSESDDGAMEEVPVDIDEIEEVLVEKKDFGSSLPARDEKKSGVNEDDGSECLMILAK